METKRASVADYELGGCGHSLVNPFAIAQHATDPAKAFHTGSAQNIPSPAEHVVLGLNFATARFMARVVWSIWVLIRLKVCGNMRTSSLDALPHSWQYSQSSQPIVSHLNAGCISLSHLFVPISRVRQPLRIPRG